MESNDIVIVTFMDPQTPQLWVKMVGLIQRSLDADTYSQAQFQLSEDGRSLRAFVE